MRSRHRLLLVFTSASLALHVLLLMHAPGDRARPATRPLGMQNLKVVIEGNRPAHSPAFEPVDRALTTTRPAGTPAPPRAAPQANSPDAINALLGELQTALSRHLVYPTLARRRGWEGVVTVSLRVDADGHLADIQLAESSGYDLLDQTALRALRDVGRVRTAIAALQQDRFRLRLPIHFRLRGADYGSPTL